jgi:hypothetical protein
MAYVLNLWGFSHWGEAPGSGFHKIEAYFIEIEVFSFKIETQRVQVSLCSKKNV